MAPVFSMMLERSLLPTELETPVFLDGRLPFKV